MGQVSLKATMAYAYAGVSLRAGDQFLASEKDANLLKAVGRAIDAPVLLRTSALVPESDAVDSPGGTTPEPTRTKRQYRRRDLTAEP